MESEHLAVIPCLAPLHLPAVVGAVVLTALLGVMAGQAAVAVPDNQAQQVAQVEQEILHPLPQAKAVMEALEILTFLVLILAVAVVEQAQPAQPAPDRAAEMAVMELHQAFLAAALLTPAVAVEAHLRRVAAPQERAAQVVVETEQQQAQQLVLREQQIPAAVQAAALQMMV